MKNWKKRKACDKCQMSEVVPSRITVSVFYFLQRFRSDWPQPGERERGLDFHLLKGQLVWSFLFLFYYDITRVKCGEVRGPDTLGCYRGYRDIDVTLNVNVTRPDMRDMLQMEGAGWRGQEALCGGGGQAAAAPPTGQWQAWSGSDD